MATGGKDISSEALFECSVCLESMLTKDPRLLTCGHTFCTPCIKKLAAKSQITCPKCRAETAIPSEGVQKLPKNVEYIAMSDAMKGLPISSKDPEDHELCGPCLIYNKRVKASHECNKCPKNLICRLCADKHSRYRPLQSHDIQAIKTQIEIPSSLCSKHKEPLAFFCGSCQTGLCLHCIYGESHAEHEDKVVDFESGVNELRKDNVILVHLGKKRNIMKNKIEGMKQDFKEMNQLTRNLRENQKVLEKQLKLVSDYMKTVTQLEKSISKELTLLTGLEDRSSVLTKQWNLMEKVDHHEFLHEIKILREESQNLIKKIEENNGSYTIATYIPGIAPSMINMGQLQTVSRHVPEHDKPELVLEIKPGGNVNISNPHEILSVGDGIVIVVCQGSKSLQQIDVAGKVIKEYKMDQNVQSAAVNDELLYVAIEGNKIIKMALDESAPRLTYQPNSDSVTRIAASENGIVISDFKNPGNLVEFDTVTSIIPASNMNYPWFVSSAMINGEYTYILTEWGAKKINVYNKDWKLTTSITKRGQTGFQSPEGNVLTSGGKILVADCDGHTISEYKMDGTYIRDLLCYPAITKPSGILYDSPYLWVSEETPSIKLFWVD